MFIDPDPSIEYGSIHRTRYMAAVFVISMKNYEFC